MEWKDSHYHLLKMCEKLRGERENLNKAYYGSRRASLGCQNKYYRQYTLPILMQLVENIFSRQEYAALENQSRAQEELDILNEDNK